MSNPNDSSSLENTTTADNGITTTTTTTTWRAEMLRQALPDCQPQEGSPANTFTNAEKEKLQPFLPNMQVHHATKQNSHQTCLLNNNNNNKHHQMDILEPWTALDDDYYQPKTSSFKTDNGLRGDDDDDGTCSCPPSACSPQEAAEQEGPPQITALDWHGAPRFATPNIHLPREFRQAVRQGRFTGPTNGVCPGFLQCNLVVLPPGQQAFDFLLFCQRNPKACPLIEVCQGGSPIPVGVAPDADLRTDCPK